MNIKFRNNQFSKTSELIKLISNNADKLKMRSDQSIVYKFNQINRLKNTNEALNFIDDIANL